MADEKAFPFTANLLQEIPEDTVIVRYQRIDDLMWFARALHLTAHLFVVDTTKQQIAFSKQALRDIERLA